LHCRAKLDGARKARRINDIGARQNSFKFFDAAFDKALFFERSPCSRASAIALMTAGRSTDFNCFNSSSSAAWPARVIGIFSIFACLKTVGPKKAGIVRNTTLVNPVCARKVNRCRP
jgi:hypothetical protein